MYKITPFGSILRTSDNAMIPVAPENTDYIRYQEWVAEGNVAEKISQADLDDLFKLE